LKLNNFFTSGWVFDQVSIDLKSRYQMINLGIVLSTLSLIYAITANVMRDKLDLIPVEIILILANLALLLLLRKDKKYFELVSFIVTAQFTFFFLFLVYVSEPSELKHVWMFTYSIVLLYFHNTKCGIYWFSILIFFLIIAPLQNFIEVQYTLFQVTYIAFVLIVINVVINFYQIKMKEAKDLILQQQESLRTKIAQLEEKDVILGIQSKQAVMGEMISMIAHQWRQPLSTITLQISNLEIKKLLGEDISEKESADTLSQISTTIVYLSDTIDDFQRYFQANKEPEEIGVFELLQKASNFVLPRLKATHIDFSIETNNEIQLLAHINELIQVILHILNNAIDSLIEKDSDNAKVIVKVIDLVEEIEIVIEDNANGISDANLSYLFEPYFSTKGKNGTGLGLYMSQMIIEKQFNGTISVETSSKGSSFIVKIPKRV